MNYLKKSFSVSMGQDQKYRENFGRIFGKKPAKKPKAKKAK